MPYIEQKDRRQLDPLINNLVEEIVKIHKSHKKEGVAFAGILNYAITCLLLKTTKAIFGSLKYWTVAVLSGILKNISDEFYRRIASGYEDRQITKNKDIDIYKGYLNDIKRK